MPWDRQGRTPFLPHPSQRRAVLRGLQAVPPASPKQGPDAIPSPHRAAWGCPGVTQGSLGTIEVCLGALSLEESLPDPKVDTRWARVCPLRPSAQRMAPPTPHPSARLSEAFLLAAGLAWFTAGSSMLGGWFVFITIITMWLCWYAHSFGRLNPRF